MGANNELSRMVNENIKLVYWRIWGLSHTFDCEICKQHLQVKYFLLAITVKGQIRPGSVTVIKGQIKPVLIS